jgi:hypothetical protein
MCWQRPPIWDHCDRRSKRRLPASGLTHNLEYILPYWRIDGGVYRKSNVQGPALKCGSAAVAAVDRAYVYLAEKRLINN